jgi:hypothetical protein
MRVKREEFAQRGIEALWLFLLHPVPSVLDEVWAGEGGAAMRGMSLRQLKASSGNPCNNNTRGWSGCRYRPPVCARINR